MIATAVLTRKSSHRQPIKSPEQVGFNFNFQKPKNRRVIILDSSTSTRDTPVSYQHL